MNASDGRLRQRADYTHKANTISGRHGWLRLTPAYSVKVVEELIALKPEARRILDPFCGTATTALAAACQGHNAVTTDINPFLVWLGQAKTRLYRPEQVENASRAASAALADVKRGLYREAPVPPIHNIERWWEQNALRFLCALRGALDDISAGAERDLLDVAFCRTLMASSNAAFNHQSMSFKDENCLDLGVDYSGMFGRDVAAVLKGAAENPYCNATVLLADARNLSAIGEREFDLVVTSPPYANRMSYIRELRPYMYWLGFLVNGRNAGDLDWQAIGGTWGIATSRLNDWVSPKGGWMNTVLADAVARVAAEDNRSAAVLSVYITKYFEDVWTHLCGLPPVLSAGAEVHYIVGNSTFYGVLIPVEQLYAKMLSELGFHSVEHRPIRKRNSKKELVEFDVVARWR